jgi:hypothetical protein
MEIQTKKKSLCTVGDQTKTTNWVILALLAGLEE